MANTVSPTAAYWRERVVRQQRSGVGVRGFCRANGYAEHAFYWWRAKLGLSPARGRKKMGTSKGVEFARVVVEPFPGGGGRDAGDTSAGAGDAQSSGQSGVHSSASGIVEPPVASVVEPLRLMLAGGRQLVLPTSMPIEQVARLVRAIEGACPEPARRELVERVEGAT